MRNFKLEVGKAVRIKTNYLGDEYTLYLTTNKKGKDKVVLFWNKECDKGHQKSGASLHYKRKEVERWINRGSWKII